MQLEARTRQSWGDTVYDTVYEYIGIGLQLNC